MTGAEPNDDDDRGGPADRVGCCFPGECCMPGEHTRDECHTVGMIEAFELETRMAAMLDQLTDFNLVTSLRSTTCPSCGGPKQAAQSMCKREYFKLPRPMQQALYMRLGSGYRESVAAAMEFLRAETFRLPPGAANRDAPKTTDRDPRPDVGGSRYVPVEPRAAFDDPAVRRRMLDGEAVKE